MRVGIEIGGTFSDLVAVTETGEIQTAKALSTPKNPADGALDALKRWRPDANTVDSLVHGSTVATNTVIERLGAPTMLVVTQGHKDILEIQRHEKSEIFNINYTAPVPLIARHWVIEACERIDASGNVILPLMLDDAFKSQVTSLVEVEGIQSVAVCLLHSYLDSTHEIAIGAWFAKNFPTLQVSLSSSVNPEYREYERASTTVMSAYLKPVIASYMGNFERLMRENGLRGDIQIMQSSGGIIPLDAAQEKAVNVVFSGPAAGVVGAIHMARLSGIKDFITLDMGGTSTDVCLVRDFQATICYNNKVDGLPVRMPTFDIHVVGAGGGSIASLDEGGFMHVGPGSAGADPGPCCYGRGGVEPTATDATALMGILRPHRFFGGGLELRLDLAGAAVERLATNLGMTVMDVAEGIRRIANNNMTQTIRLVSIERGHNPRDFAILAYGGAGALHACEVADDLRINTVVVPEHQGVLSALGLLASDFTLDLVRSLLVSFKSLDITEAVTRFVEMEAAAFTEFARYGIGKIGITLSRSIDVRYSGQASELNMQIGPDTDAGETLSDWARAFHRNYKERFGHSFPDKSIELVNLRLVAGKQAANIRMAPKSTIGEVSAEEGEVYFGGRLQKAKFFWRPDLPAEFSFAGPGVVEDHFATTFVPPSWELFVEASGSLIIKKVTQP